MTNGSYDAAPASDTLAALAYCRLEEMIVDGSLAPGTLLSEHSLSQLLGVGRTPVREALQRLVSIRLVKSILRRGYIVNSLDVHDLFAMLDFRRELERFVASRAATRITDEERPVLHQLASELRVSAEQGDTQSVLRIDREFKERLVALCANEFVKDAIAPAHALSRQFYFANVTLTNKTIGYAHAELLDSVGLGDPHRAAAASDHVMDEIFGLARAIVHSQISNYRPLANQ